MRSSSPVAWSSLAENLWSAPAVSTRNCSSSRRSSSRNSSRSSARSSSIEPWRTSSLLIRGAAKRFLARSASLRGRLAIRRHPNGDGGRRIQPAQHLLKYSSTQLLHGANRYPAPVSKAPSLPGSAIRGGQGSRILVIGCGFIGSHIVEELVASSCPPIVLTRSRPDAAVADLIAESDLHLGDARDPEVLDRALDGVGHVIFSAGGLLPAASEENTELDERLTLTPVRTVLDALRSRPGVTLTYLSSGGTVYGEPKEIPVSEDAPTQAFGAYGQLHLTCEAEVMCHHRELGLRTRILRCSTVYGEHQRPNRGQGAIVTFLHRIERDEPIDLYGGGTTVRDYVYTGDVARIVAVLIGLVGRVPILHAWARERNPLSDVPIVAQR